MARHLRARPGGGIEIALPTQEHELLRSLPGQLAPILSGEHEVAGARERLFPPAYHDPEDDADYRELVGPDLIEERQSALRRFEETLAAGRQQGQTWRVELDFDQAEAWLSATNDARLILALVIGIESESQWDQDLQLADPAHAALWYLGWLQEELLTALSASSPTG